MYTKKISRSNLKEYFKYSFSKLELNNNNINNKYMKYIIKQLEESNVRAINLSNNKIDTKGFIKLMLFLNKNNKIEELNISSNNMDASFMDKINFDIHIKKINLSYNNISDKGIIYMKDLFINLSEINISKTNLTKDGIATLSDFLISTNSNLEILDLSDNDISNEGASIIANIIRNNNKLKNINLFSDNIGVSGSIDIASALKENKTLKILNMECNPVQTEGIHSFTVALYSNNSLIELNLPERYIGNREYNMLKEVLEINKTIQMLDQPIQMYK
jgi:Ran GTPase-activating protein (RanGAP) involved in mRNA processing and transport